MTLCDRDPLEKISRPVTTGVLYYRRPAAVFGRSVAPTPLVRDASSIKSTASLSLWLYTKGACIAHKPNRRRRSPTDQRSLAWALSAQPGLLGERVGACHLACNHGGVVREQNRLHYHRPCLVRSAGLRRWAQMPFED